MSSARDIADDVVGGARTERSEGPRNAFWCTHQEPNVVPGIENRLQAGGPDEPRSTGDQHTHGLLTSVAGPRSRIVVLRESIGQVPLELPRTVTVLATKRLIAR